MYVKEGITSQENKSLTQKPNIRLRISNRNAFSKASHKLTFLGEIYQKTPTMTVTWKPSLKTPMKILLRSNDNVLHHSHKFTHDKKRLVRSRIFVGIKYATSRI